MSKSESHSMPRLGVSKHLVCLTDKAEADLRFVVGCMQVSQSEAIRQGLGLMASRILEKGDRNLPSRRKRVSPPK